jgi:hypothetical protein
MNDSEFQQILYLGIAVQMFNYLDKNEDDFLDFVAESLEQSGVGLNLNHKQKKELIDHVLKDLKIKLINDVQEIVQKHKK